MVLMPPCADAVYLLDSMYGVDGNDTATLNQTGNVPDNYTQYLTTGFLSSK